MNRKEKVINLFEFLMEFIEEPEQPTKETPTNQLGELDHPDPNLVASAIRAGEFDNNTISRIQELIEKTEKVDEKKAEKLGVQRIVQQTIKPILESLNERATNEHINDFADRTGVTFDEKTGKLEIEQQFSSNLVEVEVPTDLRDEVPQGDPQTEELDGNPPKAPTNPIPQRAEPKGMTLNVEGEFEDNN